MEKKSLYLKFYENLLRKKNRFASTDDLLKMTSPIAHRASAYVYMIKKVMPNTKIINVKVWSKEYDALIWYYMLIDDVERAQREITRFERTNKVSLNVQL